MCQNLKFVIRSELKKHSLFPYLWSSKEEHTVQLSIGGKNGEIEGKIEGIIFRNRGQIEGILNENREQNPFQGSNFFQTQITK